MQRHASFLLAFSLLIGLSISSCGSLFTHRMYSGPLLPRADVAILVNRDIGGLSTVIIVSVDGRSDCANNVVEMLSGNHTLGLRYGPANYVLSHLQTLGFEAKAGHTYVVYGTDNIDSHGAAAVQWWPHVNDITDHLADPEWLTVKSGIDKYWATRR